MSPITSTVYNGISAGTILPCARNSALPGTLLCDGSAVSRSVYAALFSAIGTTYGSGDGSTTFNLPDTRGIFLRGAGTNPSNAANTTTIGARQLDDNKSHWHKTASGQNNGLPPYLIQYGLFGSETTADTVPRTKVDGGPEARPANLGVNFCISY